jgi:hypothetical protein
LKLCHLKVKKHNQTEPMKARGHNGITLVETEPSEEVASAIRASYGMSSERFEHTLREALNSKNKDVARAAAESLSNRGLPLTKEERARVKALVESPAAPMAISARCPRLRRRHRVRSMSARPLTGRLRNSFPAGPRSVARETTRSMTLACRWSTLNSSACSTRCRPARRQG